MGKKVFISYDHNQVEWVEKRLVPSLEAGGADILIDYREFAAGRAVIGQMDSTQDKADVHILVLTDDYLTSEYCQHEMNRAIKLDPDFQKGIVLPVMRSNCHLPDSMHGANMPIYVDLQNDTDAVAHWDKLMNACETNLGATVSDWLKARDEIQMYIERGVSVNLVTYGRVKWRELLDHVKKDYFNDFGIIDVEDPMVTTRKALVEEILVQCGTHTNVSGGLGEDLVALGRVLSLKDSQSRLVIKHFHEVINRRYYDIEFFSSLRYLITESRKLVLLIQSRIPFIELLPHDHPLSSITNLKTIELRGRP